jgi:cell division protein YceG involved in septum cleavage
VGTWLLVSSFFGKFFVDVDVTVRSGDTFGVFYDGLSDLQVARIKRYIRKNTIDMSRLEIGSYAFSGKYNPASFVARVLEGSEKNFMRVTILEGWSIYDIDDYLTKQ